MISVSYTHLIGWERAEKDMESRHAPDPITWVDSTAEAAFIFTGNGSYNAYARDLAAVSYTHLLLASSRCSAPNTTLVMLSQIS